MSAEVDSMHASVWGRDLRERLDRDAAALPVPPSADVVTEDEVAQLPLPVQRYLRFMNVVGRPAMTSFRAHLRGEFRLRPDRPFMRSEVWQYNAVAPIARLYWMRIDMVGGMLPMVGRDSYLDGRGRMLGKLFDVWTIADGEGEPFDIGELTTWLNDAVLMAPSMLLRAAVTFTGVDERSFEVRIRDAGHTVSARVLLDERGAPVDFETEDRYADLPGGPVRTRWSTPIEGWQHVGDGWLPRRGSAVWHLPDGDFTYGTLAFDADGLEVNPLEERTAVPARGAGRLWHTVGGAASVAYHLIGSPWLRDRYNHWGVSREEWEAAMPGDELVPDPVLLSTRGITIDAPAEVVWPWLAQIGQGRGGLYSYDGLENLVGLDIHSVDTLLGPEQQVRPGDLVRLGKPGSPCFSVLSVDPPRSLVLVSADPVSGVPVPTPVEDGHLGATWQWLLRPVGDGTRTRLLSRQRNTHPAGQRVLWRIVEPIGFVMERRMLQGVKERAERSVQPSH